MQGKLIFNLPEEQEEFEAATKGIRYKYKLEEIWQVFFRPRHKHFYDDPIINDLLGANATEETETEVHKACNLLMDRLEILYRNNFGEDVDL